MRRQLILSALLLGAVAAPTLAQRARPSLAEACPKLTREEISRIENYKGKFAENALYARAYCVSIEEAERRMEIQNRDAIGPKTEPGRPPRAARTASARSMRRSTRRRRAPSPDFGSSTGPTIEWWSPSRATPRRRWRNTRRIRCSRPLDRPGPTLVELRAMQERLVREFTERGFRWSGAGAREDKGIIEITLAQEAAPIRDAAARGEFPLPPWVVLVEPKPLPIPAPPLPAAGDDRVRSFPQFAFRTDMYMRTLVGAPDVPATLRLVGGCLVLQTEKDTRTALWQASDALDLSDPTRVTVLDRLSGARIAAGEAIVLMGLQPGEEQVPKEIVGTEGCAGPYRVVRGFVPRAAWDAERRQGSLNNRINELGDPAAAAADYAADQARLPRLRAWRERMLAERSDAVAAISIDEDQATAHMFHTSTATRQQLVPAALLPFVTAQQVPVGHAVLEAARASLERQLGEAGLKADLQVEPIQGIVSLRPADPRQLSAAAAAGRIRFPEVTRITFEGAMPVADERLRRSRDPEAVWLRLEAAPDFAAIRKLVEATALPVIEPSPPPTRGTGTRQPQAPPRARHARPSRAASLQKSQFLVAYGQTAGEIAALKARGFDPVDALDAMNGRATPTTSALLARQVVVAELIGLNTKDRGRDGFRSTAQWRVVETLKGDARPGDTLRVRMVSGEELDGRVSQSNEEPPILPAFPVRWSPAGAGCCISTTRSMGILPSSMAGRARHGSGSDGTCPRSRRRPLWRVRWGRPSSGRKAILSQSCGRHCRLCRQRCARAGWQEERADERPRR
jgi:hypothetical protein